MNTLADLIIILILAAFVVSGFRRGFVRSLVDLVGGIAAIAGAAFYSRQFAAWLQAFSAQSGPTWLRDPLPARAAAVLILFVIFEALIQAAAHVLDHVFHLPVLRQVNSLLGGVLGFCKGAVVVLLACAVLQIALPQPISDEEGQVWQKIGSSRIYQAVSAYNPIYMLFQSDLWNEVSRNEKKS